MKRQVGADVKKVFLVEDHPAQSGQVALHRQPGAGLRFLAKVAAGSAQTKLVEVVGTKVERDAAVFVQRLEQQLVTLLI